MVLTSTLSIRSQPLRLFVRCVRSGRTSNGTAKAIHRAMAEGVDSGETVNSSEARAIDDAV